VFALSVLDNAHAQKGAVDALRIGVEARVLTQYRRTRTRQVIAISSTMRPGFGDITSTRSDRPIASSMLWVMNSTVLRVSIQRSSRSCRICVRVIASSAPNGSSISRIDGWWIRARAIDTRCRMPPDNWRG
jgi:hypothetical protein